MCSALVTQRQPDLALERGKERSQAAAPPPERRKTTLVPHALVALGRSAGHLHQCFSWRLAPYFAHGFLPHEVTSVSTMAAAGGGPRMPATFFTRKPSNTTAKKSEAIEEIAIV